MIQVKRKYKIQPLKHQGSLFIFLLLGAVIVIAGLMATGKPAPVSAQGSIPSDDLCVNTQVINDPDDGRYSGLIEDCRALLKLIEDDTITGGDADHILNWNAGVDIYNWVGVTIKPGPGSGSSAPRRVTALNLARGTVSSGQGENFNGRETFTRTHRINTHLTGTLPSALGDLDALTSLDISCVTDTTPNNYTLCTDLTMGLDGSIPDELGNLINLETLYLQGNRLTGSIPEELGNLNALEILFLQGNYRLDDGGTMDDEDDDDITAGLSGSIPDELGNLVNLERLSLSENDLSGDIPATLGNLAKLELLYLKNNDLDGSIPAELGNLEELTVLHLETQRGNKLTGNIPATLGNLENLEELHANGNALAGSIPTELGDLEELKKLYLNDNKLTGNIPESLGYLTRLTHVGLADNEFSGCIPNDVKAWQTNDNVEDDIEEIILPNCTTECNATSAAVATVVSAMDVSAQEIQQQCRILQNIREDLEHAENANSPLASWNDYSPLTDWVGVEFAPHPDGTTTGLFVTKLDLSDATLREAGATGNLEGSLPTALGELNGLQELLLNNNQLTGQIPVTLPELEHLEILDLSNNRLSGNIPTALGRVGISGTQTVTNSNSLKELRLNNNQLTGQIPAELGNLWGTDEDGDRVSLEVLDLSNNQLNGGIPAELEKLNKLKTLQLNNNQLTGGIPDAWSDGNGMDLSNLETLDLSNNQLSGEVDPTLQTLTKLRVLRLNNQKADSEEDRDGFSSIIPPQLSALFRLRELNLADNNLTGLVSERLKNLVSLRSLNIANNSLVGTLPEELNSLAATGNLNEIKVAGNQLRGCIPADLRAIANNDFDMVDLEFCDLAPTPTPIPGAPTPIPGEQQQLFLPLVRR